MKPSALPLFAILLAGCAQVPDPFPTPPGMPLDSEPAPEFDERAIFRTEPRNFPSF